MSDSLQPFGACQAPLSMGFSQEEYQSRCCSLHQGILLTQGPNLSLQVFCTGRQILYYQFPGKIKKKKKKAINVKSKC